MVKHILENNIVYSIHHSETGYMWFSTDTGISRYDGFRTRNFTLTSQNDSVLYPTKEAVSNIIEDNNVLYLELLEGGLICFDEKKEIYIPVETNINIPNKEIYCIYHGDKQLIYIGTNRGLFKGKISREEKKGKEIIQLTLSEKPVITGTISKICGDNKEIFIASYNSEIWKLSVDNGKVEKLEHSEDNKRVTAFYLEDRYLWTCFSQGNIKCYDRKQKTERIISDIDNLSRFTLSDTEINAIAAINENTYYIATWNDLFQLSFDGKDKIKNSYTIDLVKHPKNLLSTTQSEKLTSVYWDKVHKNLWISTFGNGVTQCDFTQDNCKWISQAFGNDITGIEQDMQGRIWLAVKRRGIWRSTSESLTTGTQFEPWTKGVRPDETYSLFKDADGFLWLGSKSSEITCMNPLNGETRDYHLSPANAKGFSDDIEQLCVDARNRLWIITMKGLVLFDTQTNECSLVLPSDKHKSIKEVYSVVEDKGGNIWLGTNNGLKQIVYSNGAFRINENFEKKAGIETSPAYFVSVNSNNQLFVSYLNRWVCMSERSKEKADYKYSVMNVTKGPIYCMVDDQNGNVWVGDNSGIFTIRNNRSSCYRYAAIENSNKACRLRDGRLLWANANELFFFDPETIKNSQNQCIPVLTELELNGETLPAGKNDYTFYSEDNNITFCFSDLRYNSTLQKLSYRLLPDEEWKTDIQEEGITYKDLPVGKYTLQVKLTYPNDTESKITEISISISNVWWKTFWAYILYLLLFIAIMFAIYHYANYKAKKRTAQELRILKLKERLCSEQTKYEQNQEIENIRDKWLELFVKELRSPLSLIISPLKDLTTVELPPAALPQVQLAYRNSMGLLDICDRLSTVYAEKPLNEKLQVASYSIEKLIDEAIATVDQLIRMHPIEFHCKKKVTKGMQVYMDYKWMSFVLHNLLSNAFNHIGHKGTVSLSINETTKEEKHYCTISVYDSGKHKVRGLQECLEDSKENRFKGWSSIEMGYEIMERIIQNHHGTMEMESEEEKGTKITLKLPIGKELLENDENIIFIDPQTEEELAKKSDGTHTSKEDTSIPTPAITADPKEEEIGTQDEFIPDNLMHTNDDLTNTRAKEMILIVEDHKDIRLYLSILLKAEYNIITANNGKEGVEMANLKQPDLILCDIMMPVMDGFICCKEVKEGVNTCHIPLIILTAKIEDEDIIHGLNMGADDYILKPFSPNILKAKIRNLINGRIALKQMYTRMLTIPQSNNEQLNSVEGNVENPLVNMVVKIVEDNIGKADFNVKKLAAEMNMSQPTLYRKIKLTTDFTLVELIRGVRMRKAATLLQQKTYNIQEIAEIVGYNDVPTFRKHFVDVFGVPPSVYANRTNK